MYVSAETVDDVLRRTVAKLINGKNRVRATRGRMRETFGVLLRVTNPRARLSRTEKRGTLFSCLGELLWYLAKTNDLGFINYYAREYRWNSDDGETIRGAYGPRLFNMNGQDQIANITSLLRSMPTSRRAVIQLFEASDLEQHYKDIPCTCTMQFVVRRKQLHMFTNMRSNDAFLGLPHDVFAFTMIQEILARSLGVRLGTYSHAVGSLHLYERDVDSARAYLHEGWQRRVCMPRMPTGDPWPSVQTVLVAERKLRGGGAIDAAKLGLDPYWADIVRLLQIYQLFRTDKRDQIPAIKDMMVSRIYDPYIEKKQQATPKSMPAMPGPRQLSLFLDSESGDQ